MDTTTLLERFNNLYESTPLLVRSPGRVNIIGEHTDYNDGFVLPAAIDMAIYVAVGKREDEEIYLFSEDLGQNHASALSSVARSKKGWPNYILGVVDQLQKRGYQLGGFNLVLDGNVPLGAGLSSSAAVECAVVFALNELFSLNIDRMEMVRIAQMAEHTFAGVMCGIMDQFISMFGKKGYVVKLDCRSLEYEYIPLELNGYLILLLNTNVKHSHASSAYNTRRVECEQGTEWVREHLPHIQSLRDVTVEMLEKYIRPRDELIYRRCRYVVDENQRLLQACEALKKGQAAALGKKMFQTHEGLSKDYEVSCKELDFLVDAVKNDPNVLGARMMGGGFGGCTINLVKEGAVIPLVERLSEEYKAAMGLELSFYTTQVEQGTERLAQEP